MSTTNRVQWITHNEKKILSVDYSELAGDDFMKTYRDGKDELLKEGSEVLIIAIYKGTKINKDFLKEAKKSGIELDHLLKKMALIGISGLQKIFVNGYVRFTGQKNKVRLFPTAEDSLNWLTKD